MRHSVFGLVVLALAGCAPRVGKFKDDHFAHEYHTYRIGYAGSGVDRIMGPDWEPVNWQAKAGEGRWSYKAGTQFAVTRTFDFDADGNQDYFRIEAIRDFEFKHRTQDARMWLQVLPMPAGAAATDLAAVAEGYLAAAEPNGLAGAKMLGDPEPCEVSGRSAMQVSFDAAGKPGLLVVVDPGEPEKVGPNNLDARIFYYAVYTADPQQFTAAEKDFAGFLDRLAVGTSKKTIPDKPAPTTCRGPQQPGHLTGDSLETEAPVMEPTEPEEEAAEPEPEPSEPEEDAEADEEDETE